MKKVRRGRPPLSPEEKARRAKEREGMKVKGKRGRPAKMTAKAPYKALLNKIDVTSVVTFANHLIEHEKNIVALTAQLNATTNATNEFAMWTAKVSEQFNALEAKCLKAVEKCETAECRLQKLEDIIDFEETPKPVVKKVKKGKDPEANGELHDSEPSN